MTLRFAEAAAPATPLHLVGTEDLARWRETLGTGPRAWLDRTGFTGAQGEVALLPDGDKAFAVVGHGTPQSRSRGRFPLAAAVPKLPEGIYDLVTPLPEAERAENALGWLLARHVFDRYKKISTPGAALKAPAGLDATRIEAIANGEALTRDLINTPANDMGPDELEAAARALAETHGADLTVTRGEDLLAENFPLIHTVGRASPRAPRLIDLRWGDAGPSLTLVGKGVCFDTGGLNLKPGSSMGLMKKDMGGAATVLGLASMIMTLGLLMRLRVLIPAVENSVSGNSFRPQDILASRKGLSVEINNTDAEGRLVLADALAFATEEDPDCLVSMATLTGAARVAVGPDLAPFFTDDEALAAALSGSAARVADPVWRMPFHAPYESMIEPPLADLDNAPKGGMAGAITAALFLRRFAEGARSYTHFDIYGWQPTAAPARPVGGVGQGARALLDALPEILSL
ncbi:M17 family metallopeptidase [Tropicimonas sp. IMCC6043]|uniref:leucyl aminopeptidase family protein n=1 Tax=Tropicimonas sp. IMCC6043 TaxID=2510645 RepID=UPI00101C1514|nr:leucyl aminopeptidase family protein [Tropicimonas sp. IMCC6043]RYH06416.1 leucyl aminopeptidase family protein [Tropicimonas sp. IMCC6043]